MAVARKVLISIPENPVPEGGEVSILVAQDGIEIRAAHWPAPNPERARGTVVVFNGRTEFIEKYFEVIEELRSRNFAVATLDWRGQGLSTRLLTNRQKGFVGDFSQFVGDADLFIRSIVKGKMPEPYFLMAHSMGGNIALRYLGEHPDVFQKAVLCAPMTGLEVGGTPLFIVRFLSTALDAMGLGTAFALGQGKDDPDASTFEDNTVTSDEKRFSRNLNVVKQDRDLILGGVTWHWLRQAFRSIDIVTSQSFLDKVTCPILLLTATDEHFVAPSSHDVIAKRAKSVTHVVFEGARHEILQEQDKFRNSLWENFDAFMSD